MWKDINPNINTTRMLDKAFNRYTNVGGCKLQQSKKDVLIKFNNFFISDTDIPTAYYYKELYAVIKTKKQCILIDNNNYSIQAFPNAKFILTIRYVYVYGFN